MLRFNAGGWTICNQLLRGRRVFDCWQSRECCSQALCLKGLECSWPSAYNHKLLFRDHRPLWTPKLYNRLPILVLYIEWTRSSVCFWYDKFYCKLVFSESEIQNRRHTSITSCHKEMRKKMWRDSFKGKQTESLEVFLGCCDLRVHRFRHLTMPEQLPLRRGLHVETCKMWMSAFDSVLIQNRSNFNTLIALRWPKISCSSTSCTAIRLKKSSKT